MFGDDECLRGDVGGKNLGLGEFESESDGKAARAGADIEDAGCTGEIKGFSEVNDGFAFDARNEDVTSEVKIAAVKLSATNQIGNGNAFATLGNHIVGEIKRVSEIGW